MGKSEQGGEGWGGVGENRVDCVVLCRVLTTAEDGP